MFNPIERSGSISVVERSRRTFAWDGALSAIIDIVERHFDDFNGNGFYAHPRELELQRELLCVPILARLAEAIRDQRARALAIVDLGVAGLSEAHRNAALYAIALTQGFPTSTDPRTKRVVWDVRARPDFESSRFTTFSERTGTAEMHTDSSFYPMPEEQFLLYVVAAARCQGGASILIDIEDLCCELQTTAAGRAAQHLLGITKVPFRVPTAFSLREERVEYHLAPVFMSNGTRSVRWRYDSIVKGLAARPDLGDAELQAALDLVNDVVERRAPRFCRPLPDDTLLWVDNQHILHGRSDYADPARHLIRIRMSNTPNAQRIGPSGMAAD